MTLRDLRVVPGDLLEKRIVEIRELENSTAESYAIVKDAVTGEHYLHYRYIHSDIPGGAESSYHQLMPLDPDDVLGLLFNGEPYRYPEAWVRSYLRNGPDGMYIWFDPAPLRVTAEDSQEAERIRQKLLEFKRAGAYDPQHIDQLFRDIEENSEQMRRKSDEREDA